MNCTEAESIFPFQSLNNSDFSDLFATDTNPNMHNTKKLNKLFTNMHSNVFNAIPTLILDNESYIRTKDAALLFKNLNKNSFSRMCINIRSLLNPNNFNKFECFLSVLEINPRVVAVNETWEKLNTIGQHQKLNDYIYLSNPCQQLKGGGVAMTIKKISYLTLALISVLWMKKILNLFSQIFTLKTKL